MESKNISKTLGELYAELQHKSIAEKSESNFRNEQIKRRRLSERVAHYMPHAILIVWIAAYTLSAPHTASLFDKITPDIIWFKVNIKWFAVNVAPLAVEGFVFVLSAMRQYGRKKLGRLLFPLLSLSILVNIVGGIVILDSEGITINEFTIQSGWLLTSIIAGILISLVSYISGTLIVEFSTGAISMEIDSSKSWYGKVKFYALRESFYNAALRHGATPTRASKYAETMAAQYCEGEIKVYQDGTIEAVAQAQEIMPSLVGTMASRTNFGQSKQSTQSLPDFGFASMAKVKEDVSYLADSQDIMDSGHSPILSRMTKKNLITWLEDNPDSWQEFIVNSGDTKREKSEAIAKSLTGDTKGYKTVERVFDDMQISL